MYCFITQLCIFPYNSSKFKDVLLYIRKVMPFFSLQNKILSKLIHVLFYIRKVMPFFLSKTKYYIKLQTLIFREGLLTFFIRRKLKKHSLNGLIISYDVLYFFLKNSCFINIHIHFSVFFSIQSIKEQFDSRANIHLVILMLIEEKSSDWEIGLSDSSRKFITFKFLKTITIENFIQKSFRNQNAY